MSKETAVIALGLWVMSMPFLGVPRTWLTVLIIVTAAILIVLGFFLRADALSRAARRAGRDHPFAEHMPEGHDESHHEDHERKEKLSSLN